MRLGLWIVVGLLLGVFGAHFLMADKGYVLIQFRGYVVEMSVPVLLLAVLAIYLLVRLGVHLWRTPRRLGEAAGRYRSRKAGRQFTRGLIEVAEGHWSKGERMLNRGARASDAPLMNYLAAARAAQLQGAYGRRDEYLKLAYEAEPDAAAAVLLTQAELQIEHGEREQALATLARLEERYPGHPLALRLSAELAGSSRDWQRVVETLPRLRKAGAMESGELDRLTVRAYTELMAGEATDGERLETLWRDLPKPLREHPRLVGARARALVRLGRPDAAEEAVRRHLKQHWDAALVVLYGEIESDVDRQLRTAESWLGDRPDDAELLLTAGRLCVRAELWGKARSYLETSLDQKPRADTYQVYGRLLAQLGEQDAAADAFRSGLSLVTRDGTALPALEAPETRPAG